MASRSDTRTGAAAVVAGALIFAGHAGELLFGSRVPGGFYVALWGLGVLALGVALWGLRELVEGGRLGRVGVRVAMVGFVLLGLFAVQAGIALILTGDIPNNFILFALGFLLVLVGQLLFAHDLRPALGRAWALPIVGVVGLVFGLAGGESPLHDAGLIVFEASWVALGALLLRKTRREQPGTAPALV